MSGIMRAKGGKRTRLRLVVRSLSLGLFLLLLFSAAFPLPELPLPPDLFLRLDPLAATAVPLAAREWIARLLPGLLMLALSLLAGRLFCGYVCPFGITLDLARTLGGPSARARKSPVLPQGCRRIKYLLLAGVLGCALAGVSIGFWFSPIPLITRLYALLLHPLLQLAAELGLEVVRPLAAGLNIPSLDYLQIVPRRFDSVYFLLVFFATLFVLEHFVPRFWCRCLCPAGALLGLFSRRPPWRRRVHACTACGSCARLCPTGALAPSGNAVWHGECITCRTCVTVCPVRGTSFSFVEKKKERQAQEEEETRVGSEWMAIEKKHPLCGDLSENPCREIVAKRTCCAGKRQPQAQKALSPPESALPLAPDLPSRRAFLAAAGAGIGLAAVGYGGVDSLLTSSARGLLWPEDCVRPPGALPEPAFLDRCLRCGECMKVCPSNGLQPAWFAAGVEGVFSPVLRSRRGACEPDCNACGLVCPSGAISPLPLEEKRWAKIGTAVVRPGFCLAWAEGRSCVVCEEVCPYGAIACEQKAGARVPVPVVRAERCFGCGYCEQHCPVRVPAIVVYPLNALRLTGANYRETARAAGLNLTPTALSPVEQDFPENIPEDALPPGFSDG
jgi:MauM/NapG family ferredoxin protein